MLKLSGTLIGAYKSNDFTKESGEVVKGKGKLQLMLDRVLKDGSIKKELIDISVPLGKYEAYRKEIGKSVEVDVEYFGKATFYGV
jgi:hypothetical protein